MTLPLFTLALLSAAPASARSARIYAANTLGAIAGVAARGASADAAASACKLVVRWPPSSTWSLGLYLA